MLFVFSFNNSTILFWTLQSLRPSPLPLKVGVSRLQMCGYSNSNILLLDSSKPRPKPVVGEIRILLCAYRSSVNKPNLLISEKRTLVQLKNNVQHQTTLEFERERIENGVRVVSIEGDETPQVFKLQSLYPVHRFQTGAPITRSFFSSSGYSARTGSPPSIARGWGPGPFPQPGRCNRSVRRWLPAQNPQGLHRFAGL